MKTLLVLEVLAAGRGWRAPQGSFWVLLPWLSSRLCPALTKALVVARRAAWPGPTSQGLQGSLQASSPGAPWPPQWRLLHKPVPAPSFLGVLSEPSPPVEPLDPPPGELV